MGSTRIRSAVTKPPRKSTKLAKTADKAPETHPHVAKALEYARAVVAREIPAGAFVRQACQRQLDDLARTRWAYRFDPDDAERVCAFVELLPHVKGPKTGRPIRLEPWQCFLLTTVFGWLSVETCKRRFRRSYIEVPRGNAKSTLTAAVGLFMLSADYEGGAECYSAATTRDQAKIVFNVAQQMTRLESRFRARMGVEVAAHSIYQQRSGSKFEALSAEDSSLDGLNIHFGGIDELHAHKTRGVYDVLETGTGKRDQSLLWSITTAGSNRAGICYEVRSYGLKVLKRVITDDSLFATIYTIDDGDDWTDPASWQKANPNWGVSVFPDVVGQLAHKAMQLPSAQAAFKTKHLDVWVNADAAWMDMRAWDRAADPSLTPDDFTIDRCYLGMDLASKIDLSSIYQLFVRVVNAKRHYYAFGRNYLPEDAVESGSNSQYAGWALDERIITTPGNVIDFDRLEQDLDELPSRFGDIGAFGYDPFQATQLVVGLAQKGLPMVEVRPTVLNFSEPMKELEAAVLDGRFHHDGDPVLAWAVSNVVCHRDAKDNIYPRKERPENKIDPVVALLIALNRALADDSTGESVYEARGLFTI